MPNCQVFDSEQRMRYHKRAHTSFLLTHHSLKAKFTCLSSWQTAFSECKRGVRKSCCVNALRAIMAAFRSDHSVTFRGGLGHLWPLSFNSVNANVSWATVKNHLLTCLDEMQEAEFPLANFIALSIFRKKKNSIKSSTRTHRMYYSKKKKTPACLLC